MRRRAFIGGVSGLWFSLGMERNKKSLCGKIVPGPETDSEAPDMFNRVKIAMLTMQRQAWEQGVASQALLELGEKELVLMMAREAVLRQWPDGRLGQVCDNHGVTDPGGQP